VARTVPEGLLQAVEGEDASLLVAEWHATGLRDPKNEASRRLAASPVPVLITQGDVAAFDRLVVVASRGVLGPSGRTDLALAGGLAPIIARGRRVVTVAPALAPIRALFADKEEMSWIDASDPVEWLARDLAATDLPLFVGTDSAREALERVPTLAQGRFLVAVGAVHESAPREEKQPVSSPVIVGRSLRPRST